MTDWQARQEEARQRLIEFMERTYGGMPRRKPDVSKKTVPNASSDNDAITTINQAVQPNAPPASSDLEKAASSDIENWTGIEIIEDSSDENVVDLPSQKLPRNHEARMLYLAAYCFTAARAQQSKDISGAVFDYLSAYLYLRCAVDGEQARLEEGVHREVLNLEKIREETLTEVKKVGMEAVWQKGDLPKIKPFFACLDDGVKFVIKALKQKGWKQHVVDVYAMHGLFLFERKRFGEAAEFLSDAVMQAREYKLPVDDQTYSGLVRAQSHVADDQDVLDEDSDDAT